MQNVSKRALICINQTLNFMEDQAFWQNCVKKTIFISQKNSSEGRFSVFNFTRDFPTLFLMKLKGFT
jgi:hypothetical protein